MNQRHHQVFEQISKRIAKFRGTCNDDIIISLVAKALKQIEGYLTQKIRDAQSRVDQLEKQLQENYNSLLSDFKPWKAKVFETMSKGLCEDMSEIEAHNNIFEPQKLEDAILAAVGVRDKREFWFQKEFREKSEIVLQGHQHFLKAFDLYSAGDVADSMQEKLSGTSKGSLACKASIHSQQLKSTESYERRATTLRALEDLADQGSLGALNNVGYCFLNGIGCKKNQTKGIFHLKQALERGCRYSAYYLADAYMHAFKDYKKALLYFRLFVSFPISEYANVETAIKELQRLTKP